MMHRSHSQGTRSSREIPSCWFALALAGYFLSFGNALALDAVPSFGENSGELDMLVHIPAGNTEALPLVVALHGCQQMATGFDDETGLATLADATPFVLLLPQQRQANNERGCFNWFQVEDNRPGQGESASIRDMIDTAVDQNGLDPNRVYVLGLSAGGAMTAVLLANYPELFAGGAIIAGTPFDCNRPAGLTSIWWWWLSTFFGDAAAASFACGLFNYSTSDRSSGEWGEFVRDAADTSPATWPPVSLWHGDADGTVDPANLRELVEQWTDVHRIDTVPEVSEEIGGGVHEVFEDAAGVPRVEAWRIAGFPHAFPIDPNAVPEACGVQAEFILDAQICAVRRIAQFWGLIP